MRKILDTTGLIYYKYKQTTTCLTVFLDEMCIRDRAIPMALAIGRELLEGTGAIRVHGGGFAGTIQAFVPVEKLTAFKSGMEKLLGTGMCHILHIRPQGGCVILA